MDPFVEIEIGGAGVETRAEALPSQKVPSDGGQRARFDQMRAIARHRSLPRMDFNAVFYNQEQRDALALIFLRQARFMEDFKDNYSKAVPFSSYYPVYQMMNYEQLRTYFTWRTRVREGHVGQASVSYAFLYVYELINQIGTGGHMQGLQMLLDFRNAFSQFDNALDKHIIRWFKDYHVYYNIPGYVDFINRNGFTPLTGARTYASMDGEESRFAFYNAISNYNIAGGGYFNDENAALIREACLHVMDELAGAVNGLAGGFNTLLFPGSPPKLAWKPFAHALFVPDGGRPESMTVLAYDEVYIYRKQAWTSRGVKHGNRRLIGYIFKKIDECLRRQTRFHRGLTAELNTVDGDTLRTLQLHRLYLDKFVEERTAAFFAEKNKVVVSVDKNALVKIREEALETQERLTVEEGSVRVDSLQPPQHRSDIDEPLVEQQAGGVQRVDAYQAPVPEQSDPWAAFIISLTTVEREALRVVLNGGSLKDYADSQSVMAEVLTEGINEKAVDAVGDTLMEYDGQAMVYEEYIDSLKAYLD
jgi:hypothetical protein